MSKLDHAASLTSSDAASTRKATLQHRATNRKSKNTGYDVLILRRKVANLDRQRFHSRSSIFFLQLCSRAKYLAVDVPGRELKFHHWFAERIRRQHELPFAHSAHFHPRMAAITQRQWMQQMCWLTKIDAREQREIVGSLQQLEVIEDGGIGRLSRRKPRISRNLLFQRMLKCLLLFEKLIEKRQFLRRDRRAVGVLAQQTKGVHGNQYRGVRIFAGDQPNSTVPHGEVVGKIDLFKRRVFPDKFDGKRTGLPLTGDLRRGIPRRPSIVVARNPPQNIFPRLRRQKQLVAPAFGKRAGKARVIRMRHEPPSSFALQSQHGYTPCMYSAASFNLWRASRFVPPVQEVPLQNLHHKKETEAQYRGGQHQCKQIVRLQLGGCVEDRVSESSLADAARAGIKLTRYCTNHGDTARDPDTDKKVGHGVRQPQFEK